MHAVGENERHRLAHRAASLHERLEAPAEPEPAAREISDGTRETLERWAEACSLSNREAFRRRLSWDGLDEARAAVRLEAFDARQASRAWIVWIDRFSERARMLSERLADAAAVLSSQWTGVPEDLPFRELWLPFVEVAREELEARYPQTAALGPRAAATLVEGLAREVAAAAELAFYEAFCEFRERSSVERSSPAPDTIHQGFVGASLGDGLQGLLSAYPVVARDLARLVETWVDACGLLLTRSERDRDALAQRFDHGRPAGAITTLVVNLSDRHDGGRRVARVGFESGLSVFYKPREVASEYAFDELLAWCRDAGLPGCPPELGVMDRGAYGWVRPAEAADFDDLADVEEYFRRSGALLCLTHLLGAEDLHMHNVVATRRGPVLIDGEGLFQPELKGEIARAYGLARAESEDSCLGSGLLSLLERDADGALRDVGGLRGEGGFPVPGGARSWQGVGTDALHYREVQDALPAAANRPRLNGKPQRPEQHAAALRRGFEETYRFVERHREELLATEGPLRQLEVCHPRIVLRNTQRYARVLAELRQPRELTDGRRRGCVVETLHRDHVRNRARPPLWLLAREEHAALDQLDVPRFTADPRSTELVTQDGESVPDVFSRPALEVIRARLARMGPSDLARQKRRLQDGLAGRVGASLPALSSPRDLPASGDDAGRHGLYRRFGERLGRELLERARSGIDGRLTWCFPDHDRRPREAALPLGLYDGLSGVLVFLAGLSRSTGAERWNEAATSASRSLLAELRRRRGGRGVRAGSPAMGLEGIGSVIYAGTLAAALTGQREHGELARAALELVEPDDLSEPPPGDVVRGVSGLILFLLAEYSESASPHTLGRARGLGLRLLEAERGGQQVRNDLGDVRDLEPPMGFAHGRSGAGLAFARLFGATGDPEFEGAALRAFERERRLVLSWLNEPGSERARTVSRPWTVSAWCNGPPGMALARALALDHLDHPAVRQDLEMALDAVLQPIGRRSDHLCCGNLGVADVLWTIGARLGRQEVGETALRLADQCLHRARRRGHFVLSASPFENRVFDPGFFRGLSGIGYQLLRLSCPQRLPSVLAFETRGASTGRCLADPTEA